MRITIPYNEVLPTRKAHDAFLFREAAELANHGLEVDLLIGKGSDDLTSLQNHYGIASSLSPRYLPILRKNNCFNLSWNRPFFAATSRFIKRHSPDAVLLSVLKQAADLVRRKQQNTKYLFEAHELAYYPGTLPKKHFLLEKQMLERVDQICVTTSQLKAILESPPYSIQTPIEVIPLAVDATKLPPPPADLPPTVVYVGQLYKGQGVDLLIDAMREVPDVQLHIFGGTATEIATLDRHLPNVRFEGFVLPSQLQHRVIRSHAFVAPFELTGKMGYVAHTKLYAYGAWGRPVIAPASPIVEEHLPNAWTYTDRESFIQRLRSVGTSLEAPLPFFPTWEKRIAHLRKILES